MKMLVMSAVVALAIPVAAGGQVPPGAMRAAPAYVAAAGASDLYEIESSRMAQTKGQSDAVRRFAGTMIDHHTQTTREVTAAATQAGMRPKPPKLMPDQQRMIARLRPLSGERFDREYVTQQRTAHDMALRLHQGYARDGDRAELKAVAAKAVPIVEQHRQMLQGL